MKIVIPMAGGGSRFLKKGFKEPKPLINIQSLGNISMIEAVVKNIDIEAEYIFIVQAEHYKKYKLEEILKNIVYNNKIIISDSLTKGAACTVLLAEEYINSSEEIMIVNSDQYIKWDKQKFLQKVNGNLDGCILTFKNNDPNCSYAKLNKKNLVQEVAEKKPISDMATVGIYYWKRGSDFIKYSKQMIEKNITTNNEFYVCPVYNEAIKDDKKIEIFNVDEYWSLGTPENLADFEKINND